MESEGRFVDYLSRAKNQNSYPKFYASSESKTGPFFEGFSCSGVINILRDKIYFKSVDDLPVKLFYEDDYMIAEYICKSISMK